MPGRVHRGHQIAQAEIVLVLETDQEHLLRAFVRIARGYLHGSIRQYSHGLLPIRLRLSRC